NYDGGSVSARALGADGRLQDRTAFVQHEPTAAKPAVHAHSIDLDAADRFALVADLGLDQLLVYAFDAERGTLATHTAASLPARSGPRHLAWHPDGRHAYVIDETSSRVTVFAYDAKAGELSEQQSVSTLPEAFNGSNTTAEIALTPDGRFLYGSNRGHDSLAIFAVDGAGGLTAVGSPFSLPPPPGLLFPGGCNEDPRAGAGPVPPQPPP